MFDSLKRKAKQALAKAVVAKLSRSVRRTLVADEFADGPAMASCQPDAYLEILPDQSSSTRDKTANHGSGFGHAEADDEGAAVVTVKDQNGRCIPALLLDRETLQSIQISINAYQRESRWLAQKPDGDEERESLRQRVLKQVYELDETLSRSLRSGAEASIVEGTRDLQYRLLDNLADIDDHRKQEINRKADLEDDRLYQDAQLLRRVGEAFYAAGLVSIRPESERSPGTLFDMTLLEDLENAEPLNSWRIEPREAEAEGEPSKEQKKSEYHKRRLDDWLEDWDQSMTEEGLWVLFRTTVISRRKVRRYTVLRDAILLSCQDPSGGDEAADARDLTERILESVHTHQNLIDTCLERVSRADIPWPLDDPAPLPSEDFEDITYWLSEMANMEEELADPQHLSDFRKGDYQTKFLACDIAQKAAKLRLEQAGIDYSQRQRAEEEATVEELYHIADHAYDVQEEAQQALTDETTARRAAGEAIDPVHIGPYLKHLLSMMVETKVSFFEKRMTFEKYGDMADFQSDPQDEEKTLTGSSVGTPPASDYNSYMEKPNVSGDGDEESVNGLTGRKVGKEPTFARWKYGLGPFRPDHVESARGWEGEDGILDGTFSDCSSYDGDESDPVLLERWRELAEKGRVAVEGLGDECLDGLSHLFNDM